MAAQRSDSLPPSELQRLWFEVCRGDDVRALALVALESGLRASGLAADLAVMAGLDGDQAVTLVDWVGGAHASQNAPLEAQLQIPQDPDDHAALLSEQGPRALESIRAARNGEGRVVLLLPPPTEVPAIIPVARAADAVLMCAGRGSTGMGEGRQIMELLEHPRVLGALLLDGDEVSGLNPAPRRQRPVSSAASGSVKT